MPVQGGKTGGLARRDKSRGIGAKLKLGFMVTSTIGERKGIDGIGGLRGRLFGTCTAIPPRSGVLLTSADHGFIL
jgi:hypothetical protein